MGIIENNEAILGNNRSILGEILNRIIGRKNRIIGTALDPSPSRGCGLGTRLCLYTMAYYYTILDRKWSSTISAFIGVSISVHDHEHIQSSPEISGCSCYKSYHSINTYCLLSSFTVCSYVQILCSQTRPLQLPLSSVPPTRNKKIAEAFLISGGRNVNGGV